MVSNSSIKINPKLLIPLTILSFLLSICAVVIAFFARSSIALSIATYLVSIPAIVVNIFLITQDHKPLSIGVPIAGLVFCKISWLMLFYYFIFSIIKNLSQAINK